MAVIPTFKIGQLHLGALADARPGQLVFVQRAGEIHSYLIFGANGVASHVVTAEAQGKLRAYDAAHMNMAKGLVFDLEDRLRLTIEEERVDPQHLDDYTSCLGFTPIGVVLCVGYRVANVGGRFPAYFSLENFELVRLEGQQFLETVWITNWALSYFDEQLQLKRVLGPPEWPVE